MKGGEHAQTVLLNYKYKDCMFGIGMFNPFSTTRHEVRNYNKYASSRKINSIEDVSHVFMLQFSWNLNFGRTQSKAQKRLNNTDTDAGIMKAGK